MNPQFTKTLPKTAWQSIVIKENNEPLVEVVETDRIKIGEGFKIDYNPTYFVRKTVADKLIEVSKKLPENVNLILIEGYRTMESQQKLWDDHFEKIKIESPNLSVEQIEDKVKMIVARPNPLANHHCGGAIDVTLCFDNGESLDMGTPYPSEPASFDVQNKYPMLCDEISEDQFNNRKILRDVMTSCSFVWYPGEWWHYCYGDRMWAVYTDQIECLYGPVELQTL